MAKIEDTEFRQEWQITFQGDLAGINVPQTTIDASSVYVVMGWLQEIEATDTQGAVHDEVQTVTVSHASGGSFTLPFEGQTTAALDHDATATEVETALEALSTIDDVTVTGSAGGPFTVTFAGALADQDVPPIGADPFALTNGTLVRTLSLAYDAASQLTGVALPINPAAC